MIELPSYLIKPIQRICKYPLILAELVKATPATHPDHSDLQEALIKLKKMAELLNEHFNTEDNG